MTEEERRLAQTKAIFIFCFSADFFSRKAEKLKIKANDKFFN
jgi:hypothetical protein